MTTLRDEEFGDIERQALELIRQRRAARVADIPEAAQIWMAIAPSWTVPLARAADFPIGQLGEAEQVLRRMAEERMCVEQQRSTMVTEGARAQSVRQEPSFFMEVAVRQELLDRVEKDPGRGLRYLQTQIALAGSGVLRAARENIEVSAEMFRWATLAAEVPDDAVVARELRERITRLLDQGKSGQALRWIEAARRVERYTGGKLSAVIEWAGRQLELAHRREDDERRLTHFYLRRRLLGNFTALVSDGDDERWALHLAGKGGVGKTMLVRYIVARWNADRSRSTARVDFDYLNPGYPSRAPGLLLTELAKDLRLNDQTGAAQRLFDRLDELADALHERWNTGALMTQSVDDALRDSAFLQILDLFVEAAKLLPQPVVLLLDTCEELAKVQADGSVPDGVRMTFATLQSLHDRMSAMRVVFSGRRPLARRGAGWSCPRTELEERPYLRLAEVGGFSSREARQFLQQEDVRAGLIEPILEYCREPAGDSVFVRDVGSGPADAGDHGERFHPFELARLAEWARAEPDRLSADLIRSSPDLYVDARIVGRITYPKLQRLIPVLALLGRLDEPTLREAAAVIGVQGRDYQVVLEELRQQEWIDVQHSGFFEVDRGLLRRLRAYYDSEARRAEAGMFVPPIAHYLRERTLGADFSQLDPSHFDALLRLLERRGRDAARWWDLVEARFATTGEWGWARTLTSRLLSEDGAVAQADPAGRAERPESRMRAAVLATHAAAIIHLDRAPEVSWIWQEVAAKASAHPTREGHWRLRVRALAGQVASRQAGVSAAEGQLSEFQQIVRQLTRKQLDVQLAASCLAAIETVVERDETSAEAARLRDAAGQLRDALESPAGESRHPELRALACSLMARIVRRAGLRPTSRDEDQQMARISLGPLCEPSDAGQDHLRWLRQGMAVSAACEPGRQNWLDWRAPADIYARIRLEFVRAAYPSALPPLPVLKEIGAWPDGKLRLPAPVTTVDGDRLASAALQLAGFIRAFSATELTAIRSAAVTSGGFLATCRAHQAFPPLFATLSEATAALGRPDAAMAELAEQGRMAERAGETLEIVQDADRAAARITCRMRLRDEGQGINSSLSKSAQLEDWALLWELAGLDGRKSTRRTFDPRPELKLEAGDRPTWNHARWRGAQADRLAAPQAVDWAVKTFTPSRPDPVAGFGAITVLLDALEAIELGKYAGRRKTILGVTERDQPDILGWADRHPGEPAQALVLLLRSEALTSPSAPADDRVAELSQRIGPRRAAEIALSEGQLLALRLPGKAVPMLGRAGEWFDLSNDNVGSVLAGICMAVTLCRTRPAAEELRRVLDEVKSRYQALCSRKDLLLPEWAQLEATAGNPATGLDGLASGSWRPWLVRLVTCLAWLRDRTGERGRCAGVQSWLVSHYGGQMEYGTALPAELDGWLSPSRAKRRWHVTRRSLTLWVSIVVGLGSAVGVALVAAASASRHKANSAVSSQNSDTLPIVIVVIISLALLAAALIIVWPRFYAFVFSKARIRVHIKSSSSTPEPGTPGLVAVTMKQRLPIWFVAIAIIAFMFSYFILFIPVLYWLGLRLMRRNRAVVSVERSARYRAAAQRLPKGMRRSFRRLRSVLRKRSVVVDLLVTQQVAWQCWEALISLSAKEVTDVADLRLRFRRTVDGARRTVVARLEEVSQVLCWTAGAPAAEIGRRGWGSVRDDNRFTVASIEFAPQQVRSAQSVPEAQVLHIIGSAVETASAVRLEIASGEPPTASPAEMTESEGGVRGDLLASEELLSLFPGVTLCILQAWPTVVDIRTSADREQTGKLRQFGAELFRLGIPFVLVIPPLPPAIGAALIDEVGAVLRKGRDLTVDLLDAVSAGQADIGDWTEADLETRLEAALDLCFYAPQS